MRGFLMVLLMYYYLFLLMWEDMFFFKPRHGDKRHSRTLMWVLRCWCLTRYLTEFWYFNFTITRSCTSIIKYLFYVFLFTASGKHGENMVCWSFEFLKILLIIIAAMCAWDIKSPVTLSKPMVSMAGWTLTQKDIVLYINSMLYGYVRKSALILNSKHF